MTVGLLSWGMDECIFCRIVSGEEDAYILFEDALTTAILDRNPAIQGHSLVMPNTHLTYLFTEEGESIAEAVFHTVRTVARAMEKTFELDGVSLFYTTPALVGDVTHAHVHLLPRYTDDQIHLALAREPLGDDADRIATRIRSHI